MKIDIQRDLPGDPSFMVLMPKRKAAPTKGVPWMKLYHPNYDLVLRILSPEEHHLFAWLLTNIARQTNMLVGRDGTYMTVKDIADQYPRHLCYRQVAKLLNGLVAARVIHKGKSGRHTKFHINPEIAFFGEYPDETLLSLFALKTDTYIKNTQGAAKTR